MLSLLQNSIKKCGRLNFPKFYRWGGGSVRSDWSFGWSTGKNNDLISIKPNINVEIKEPTLSVLLSPICSNRFLALCAFFTKLLLVKIDQNLKKCLEGWTMAVPTKNLAISGRVNMVPTDTVCFPFTWPNRQSTSISPYQSFIAANPVMVMSSSNTLTICCAWGVNTTCCSSPCSPYYITRKCHFTPSFRTYCTRSISLQINKSIPRLASYHQAYTHCLIESTSLLVALCKACAWTTISERKLSKVYIAY